MPIVSNVPLRERKWDTGEEEHRVFETLTKMNIKELRAKWKAALKQQPPIHIRKQLMVPPLAYKLSEQA